MTLPSLSIVIAVQSASENLSEILRRLDCGRHPDVEFLICHADARSEALFPAPVSGNVRVLRGPAGSLIPHLWREGILAARHEMVAITTAHCIPDDSWLDCLREADMQGIAGLGGTIENDLDSNSKDWAIFLLRYAAFAPPQVSRRVNEIAADNAVYRRSEILRHSDLLQDGFWEPSFHARFRADGLGLALEPRLRVVHRNRYGGRQFLFQRFAHGRHFGHDRAACLHWSRRVMLVALSPVLPLVFLQKILRTTVSDARLRRRLPGALPWLLLFLCGWGLGEASGYIRSLRKG